MAKGSYLGGHTVIRHDKDTDWFGAGSPEDPAYQAALKAFEDARAVYRKIEAERPVGSKRMGQQAKEHNRRLRAAFDAMEAAKPKPRTAQPRKTLSPAAEQRITQLKRDLATFATQARTAATQHEATRQELLALLAKHDLAETQYPEAKKKLTL